MPRVAPVEGVMQQLGSPEMVDDPVPPDEDVGHGPLVPGFIFSEVVGVERRVGRGEQPQVLPTAGGCEIPQSLDR